MTERQRAALVQQIDARRRARKWSIGQLACRAGYHPNSVARLLHGQNVSMKLVLHVADALGLTVAAIRPEPPPSK